MINIFSSIKCFKFELCFLYNFLAEELILEKKKEKENCTKYNFPLELAEKVLKREGLVMEILCDHTYDRITHIDPNLPLFGGNIYIYYF